MNEQFELIELEKLGLCIQDTDDGVLYYLNDRTSFASLCSLLNEQEERIRELGQENNQLKTQLQNIKELFNNEICKNEDAIEWGKNIGADYGAIAFHNEMLKKMNGDIDD